MAPAPAPFRGDIFVAPPRLKNIPELRQERYRAHVANTYTQIYVQIVFAVEGRQNLIQPEHNEELQKYITGIVSGQNQKLLAINNMPDHVHLLVGLSPDLSLSELTRDIKANSSRFVNEKRWIGGKFSWQEGFGGFSYSRSQIDGVIRYIKDQQRHHARRTFRQEYIQFLRKFQVDYNERYIFSPT
jgi:REP element-mobilizing transposase RayT